MHRIDRIKKKANKTPEEKWLLDLLDVFIAALDDECSHSHHPGSCHAIGKPCGSKSCEAFFMLGEQEARR